MSLARGVGGVGGEDNGRGSRTKTTIFEVSHVIFCLTHIYINFSYKNGHPAHVIFCVQEQKEECISLVQSLFKLPGKEDIVVRTNATVIFFF